MLELLSYGVWAFRVRALSFEFRFSCGAGCSVFDGWLLTFGFERLVFACVKPRSPLGQDRHDDLVVLGLPLPASFVTQLDESWIHERKVGELTPHLKSGRLRPRNKVVLSPSHGAPYLMCLGSAVLGRSSLIWGVQGPVFRCLDVQMFGACGMKEGTNDTLEPIERPSRNNFQISVAGVTAHF